MCLNQLIARFKLYCVFCLFTGIPQPINLRGFPTNTSVTLQWQLPGNDQQDDLYFNVNAQYCIYCTKLRTYMLTSGKTSFILEGWDFKHTRK